MPKKKGSKGAYNRADTAVTGAGLLAAGVATIFVNPLALPWIVVGVGGLGYAALVPDDDD